MLKPLKHQLGSPWPHPVVCAVVDDWLKNNTFGSAALGTVTWTVMGAYYMADWGARSLWSTMTTDDFDDYTEIAST